MSGLTQAERVVAEARLEAQAVVGALERALADEKEEGKQRLHRLRLELTGSASEQLAAQQARTKEERIEAMHARAARRFDPKGQCWETWIECWAEQRRERRLMARCAGRLARPRLVACLTSWISDWEITQKAHQLAQLGARGRATVDQAVAAEREQCQRLLEQARRELEQVQEAHGSALAAAARQRAELLERQRLELHGSAEEVFAAREARQKQERVDAMFARCGRRMTSTGILRGWEAWKQLWAHHARITRLLAHGAARLARPQLVACLSAWLSDWR